MNYTQLELTASPDYVARWSRFYDQCVEQARTETRQGIEEWGKSLVIICQTPTIPDRNILVAVLEEMRKIYKERFVS